MIKIIGVQNLEAGIDSQKSKLRPFYRFMPKGDMLLLGNVLMNYAHHLTLLVREQLFQTAPRDTELVVGLTKMNKEQCETRKYSIFRLLIT